MKNSRIVYYDSFSIAVISSKSKLRRLYCPIMVKCIHSIDDIQADSFVYVDEVYMDPDELLIYKIAGKIYPYSNFKISINF